MLLLTTLYPGHGARGLGCPCVLTTVAGEGIAAVHNPVSRTWSKRFTTRVPLCLDHCCRRRHCCCSQPCIQVMEQEVYYKGAPVSGPLLQEKALLLFTTLYPGHGARGLLQGCPCVRTTVAGEGIAAVHNPVSRTWSKWFTTRVPLCPDHCCRRRHCCCSQPCIQDMEQVVYYKGGFGPF